MSKKHIYITIMIVALLLSFANAKSPKHTKKIVILHIEQTNIPASSKLSDKQLANALLVQLTRLKNFELVEYAELLKAFDDRIVDDAVFELLVTDDLKQTLAKLDALQTKIHRLAEYCKVGKDLEIDYLIDISIEHYFTQLRITYHIINTKTAKIEMSKSFYDVPNEPIGVCDEINKRVIRSLWKLENNK